MKKKIEELVRVEVLAKHYAPQSLDDLMNSIFNEGLKERPVINCNNEIVHGHRRITAMSALGLTEVDVVVEDVDANLFEYTARNIHREKSVEDQIKDIQVVMDKFPKKQGKRNDGTPYVRHEEIIKALNNKYKDEESIRNLEYVMKNDLEDNLLMRAHIGNNESLSACVEFIKNNMEVDKKNNYGQLDRLKKGNVTVKEANKLIQKRYHLENNNGTFIIPDKCYAYQMDCTKVAEISECLNFVDHLFTSIPYFKLRDYDSELECQLGQEENKEKFAEGISLIFKALEPTLKQSANVQINVGETYVNGLGLDIPNLVKHYILKNTNLVYKETIIWQKINPGYHREYDEKRPINCTEYILWFVVNPLLAKYNNITFKKDDCHSKIDLPVDKQYRSFWNFIEEQTVYNVLKTSVGKNHEIYKIYEDGHPALMYKLLPLVPILMCTDESDVVFDPFSGASTVGRMSALLNRKALTTEISKLYYSIGLEYLKSGVEQFDRDGLDAIQNRFYQSENILINAA
jgi:site-specific DNA-methyltransferase (adenine-specific)